MSRLVCAPLPLGFTIADGRALFCEAPEGDKPVSTGLTRAEQEMLDILRSCEGELDAATLASELDKAHSTVHAALSKLVAKGLATARTEQTGRRPRILYSATRDKNDQATTTEKIGKIKKPAKSEKQKKTAEPGNLSPFPIFPIFPEPLASSEKSRAAGNANQ